MDIYINQIANFLILCIEIISILLILAGVITTAYILLKTIFTHNWINYITSRSVLSRFLLLALEFQIAADILETVLKPGWEEFAQLAATIAIRSVLSYVLIIENKSQG